MPVTRILQCDEMPQNSTLNHTGCEVQVHHIYDLENFAWIKGIYPVPWSPFPARQYFLFLRHRRNIVGERMALAWGSFEDKVSLTILYDIIRTRIYFFVLFLREGGLQGEW